MDTRVAQTVSRNYGVDLLRILAMLMVPVLHLLNVFLADLTPLTLKYELAYFLEATVFSAVNCFALISGFVGCSAKFRYSSILMLFFQVMFYTLPIVAVFIIVRPDLVGYQGSLQAIFPFAYSTYWYYTAYFCMSFFIPALQFLVEKLEKKQLQRIVLSAVLIFSLLPTVFQVDMGTTASGYSALWLGVLYLFGGYIKKYGFLEKVSQKMLLLGFVAMTVLNWGVKFAAEFLTNLLFGSSLRDGYLLSYTSPTVLLSAVLLLLLFSRMNLGQQVLRFTKFFAPAAFGVYLLHEHPLIRLTLIVPFGRWLRELPSLLMIPGVIVGAVLIWLVGSLVDRFRLWLFELIELKSLCQQWVSRAGEKWMEWVK